MSALRNYEWLIPIKCAREVKLMSLAEAYILKTECFLILFITCYVIIIMRVYVTRCDVTSHERDNGHMSPGPHVYQLCEPQLSVLSRPQGVSAH